MANADATSLTRNDINEVIVGVTTLSLNLLNFVTPGLGTALSIGFTLLDNAGGLDWFYRMFI